jgi:hypothetical protein
MAPTAQAFQLQGSTMADSEIQIDIKPLRGKKVMIATPMYGGLGNSMYFSSVLQLQDIMIRNEMQLHHCFMANESLIDRARNGLVYEYLSKSDADYLLFIDGDIQFRAEDVLAMMSFDKELICGPYPKKHINWPVVIEAIKKGYEDPAVLEKLVGEYVFTPLEEDTKMSKIIKVSEAGTGMMLIKRNVFAKMKESFPENFYISDDSQTRKNGENREMHAYFRTAIVDNRYLSEDYYFCHKWREIGGDVWLFPWSQCTHYGTYGFQGSVGHLVDFMRKIDEKP